MKKILRLLTVLSVANAPANLTKTGVNEVVVNSIVKDLVNEGAELVIFPRDSVNGWYAINRPYAAAGTASIRITVTAASTGGADGWMGYEFR